MKIVFIGPFGLQPKGTVSVRALPLARALAARGHTVTVLIPPWDDPDRSGQTWQEDGVRVANVTLPHGVLVYLPLFFHILLTQRLVGQALALQPDVVHFFKPKAYAGLAHLVLWWLRRLRGLRLRLVVDADDWEQVWNEVMPYSVAQKKFFAWQEQWGLSHADAITVASRALEELVTSQARLNRPPVFYVPNGCRSEITAADPFDTPSGRRTGRRPVRHSLRSQDRPPTAEEILLPSSVYRPPSTATITVRQTWQLGDAPTVLLYSRFLEFRLERIVTLVKSVAAALPGTRWLIIGRGLQDEEKMLESMLTQAGLAKYVRFTGWLPVERLPAHFQAADVAVYPYDDTPVNRTKCSVKLIDLMAAGLPVVADGVGQNCEYIQSGVSGLLVPAEDDVALSQALVTLLRQPETRRALGQNAARVVGERYTWSTLSQIVERAYG